MIHRIDGREAWEQVREEAEDFERQVGPNPKGFLCPTTELRLYSGFKGAYSERFEAEERAGCSAHQKGHSGDSKC